MAEQPEAPPLAVLYAVIIARWAAFALFMPRLAPPPFGGNAFGAFISDNMMQAFAPAELARRAVAIAPVVEGRVLRYDGLIMTDDLSMKALK